MNFRYLLLAGLSCAAGVAATLAFYNSGRLSKDFGVVPSASAAGGGKVEAGWPPTKPCPRQEV